MMELDLLKKYLTEDELEALNDIYFSNESDIGTKKTTYLIIKQLIVRLIRIILEKE